MKIQNLGQYLLIQVNEGHADQYLVEVKRLEWIFICIRWLWVPIIFLMAWLHEPISEETMRWIGIGVILFNTVATFLNIKVKQINLQQALGITWLIFDALFAWGIIFLFAHEFYTAAYAGFVYVIIEASIRFGLVGSLSAALTFATGLYVAYLYRSILFGIRFSNSGYVFWTLLMFVVAISIGAIVNEAKRQRRRNENYLKENTMLSERHRIARDLHDIVLKTLQGLSLEARVLGKRSAASPAVKETAEYFEQICNRTSREIREVIFDLRGEGDITHIGERLSRLLNEWTISTGIAADFTLIGQDIMLKPEIIHQVINVVSEALTNIQRHASATHVDLKVNTLAEKVEVEIADDGLGVGLCLVDLPVFVAQGKLGIANMRERVEILGGRLFIVSDEHGTRVHFSIPIIRQSMEAP